MWRGSREIQGYTDMVLNLRTVEKKKGVPEIEMGLLNESGCERRYPREKKFLIRAFSHQLNLSALMDLSSGYAVPRLFSRFSMLWISTDIIIIISEHMWRPNTMHEFIAKLPTVSFPLHWPGLARKQFPATHMGFLEREYMWKGFHYYPNAKSIFEL